MLTAAPAAELLGAWPGPMRSWEPCIMAALSVGVTQVGTEVYDVEITMEKAMRFMGMLEA